MAQRAENENVSVDTLDRLHKELGVPLADILAGLKLTDKDVERWRVAGAEPDAAAMQRLHVLMELRDGLYEMFVGPEGVHEWMHAELRYLHWRTPQQLLQQGDRFQVLSTSELIWLPLTFFAAVVEIEHRSHRIHPQSIKVKFLEPVKCIRDQKIPHFVSAVVKNVCAPIWMIAFS